MMKIRSALSLLSALMLGAAAHGRAVAAPPAPTPLAPANGASVNLRFCRRDYRTSGELSPDGGACMNRWLGLLILAGVWIRAHPSANPLPELCLRFESVPSSGTASAHLLPGCGVTDALARLEIVLTRD
jgi:hypothetical protein